jgi:hypothetical protein
MLGDSFAPPAWLLIAAATVAWGPAITLRNYFVRAESSRKYQPMRRPAARSSLAQFDRQRAGDDRWKPAMPNAFILRSLTYCRRDYAAPLQLETPEFALMSGWGAQK